jgi:hypothetical protein
MKQFKRFLSEGGNVEIDGMHYADRIPTNDRDNLQQDLLITLHELSKSFEKVTGLPIWSDELFHSKSFFSGSSQHFFSQAISNDEFSAHKDSMGDVDTQIDGVLTDKIADFLTANKGKKFGKGTFLGFKPSPDTLITLFKIGDINIQIDLEMVDYVDGKPTKWAKFSHSSDWSDIKVGIKGVFHKYLIRAIDAKNLRPVMVQMKTKTKQQNITDLAFSVGKGLRTKYAAVIENGKQKMENGLPVVVELPTAGATFVSEPVEMLALFLKRKVTPQEVTKFESFTGLVELLGKELSKDEKKKVLEGFCFTLWGKIAQQLYRDDQTRDYKEKFQAYEFISKAWGVSVPEIDLMSTTYYVAWK